MLLLLTTTDKISLISSSAANLDVVANAQDKTTSTGAIGSYSLRTAVSSATTTDIAAVPSSGIERNVKMLNVRNKHATLPNDVTVQINQNGTLFELFKATLNAGDTLEYIEGVGWFVVTNQAALDRKLIVASDVTNATTSFADVTGLTCPLLSGKKYNFEATLMHSTDATTTGARFGINIGAAPTAMAIHGYGQITSSVTAAAYGGSAMVTARDTAIVVETTGPGAVNMLCQMFGFIQPSADGIFAVRCQSEVAVAGGLVVRAGSWCRIWEATG